MSIPIKDNSCSQIPLEGDPMEFNVPVKRNAVTRPLKEGRVKHLYEDKSYSCPPSPPEILVTPQAGSSVTWEDAFFSAVPFDVPKRCLKSTCICEGCVESPDQFDWDQLFSDEPLDFYPELKSMMLQLDNWEKRHEDVKQKQYFEDISIACPSNTSNIADKALDSFEFGKHD